MHLPITRAQVLHVIRVRRLARASFSLFYQPIFTFPTVFPVWTRKPYSIMPSRIFNAYSSSSSVTDAIACPPQVIVVPILHRPLIPGFYKTISISDTSLADLLHSYYRREKARGNTPLVGAFLKIEQTQEGGKQPSSEEPYNMQADSTHSVGTLCSVVAVLSTPDSPSKMTMIVYPHYRIVRSDDSPGVIEISESNHVPIRPLEEKELLPQEKDTITALMRECLSSLATLAKLNAGVREHLNALPDPRPEEPAAVADLAAVLCTGPAPQLQTILASERVEERLQLALELLVREIASAELQQTLRRSVEERLQARHREALLQEQMRAIQRELHGSTGDSIRDRIVADFERAIDKMRILAAEENHSPLKEKAIEDTTAQGTARQEGQPSQIESKTPLDMAIGIAQEELERLKAMEVSSGEFGIIRNYLEWIVGLPWTAPTTLRLPTLAEARQILDSDHWGLTDVKQRILELLASLHLRANPPAHTELPVQAGAVNAALLLVGPPGIGKTSIAESIARALGRPFFKITLGGLGDVAEIKGHRRTYLGAMPGKIVQALRNTQTLAPLILLDEIDKIGIGVHSRGGDPAAALLEALDSRLFTDLFMDLPVDLSRVIFVATANTTETIPAPLLDRMSVIELASYLDSEKIAIATRHLIPQAVKSIGLPAGHLQLDERTLQALITGWCREPGVRQLQKAIERIGRRTAVSLVDLSDKTMAVATIKEEALPELLGLAPFALKSEPGERLLPPGVAAGLAWTPYGGSIIHIEVAAIGASSDRHTDTGEQASDPAMGILERPLRTTGHLGKVMEESATIAHSVARSALLSLKIEVRPIEATLKNAWLHLHVPEGATPKDGPSAGLAMALALLSLASGRSLKPGFGITGELTLSGRVLKIGGLREKALAARREGLSAVIFPKANLPEWVEMQQASPEPLVGPSVGLIGYPVSTLQEAVELCLIC